MRFIQKALLIVESKDDRAWFELLGRKSLEYLHLLRSQGYITIDKKADLILLTEKGKKEINVV